MEIEGEEFIRRFLLHVLPINFVKIRHYGILSNRNRKSKLKKCQNIFGIKQEQLIKPNQSWEELLLQVKGIDVKVCPVCGKGKMMRREIIAPKAYSPPNTKFVA